MCVDFIINMLVVYEIYVVCYYFNCKVYVVVVNRVQLVVVEFQYVFGIEEVFFIMSESYDKFGLIQLCDDVCCVLDKNFLNSEYVSGGVKCKKFWWQLWQFFVQFCFVEGV